MGKRKCLMCNENPVASDHGNSRYCSSYCKEKARRVGKFGLTPAEYRGLISDTKGVCPICGRNVKKWNIDHNHRTNETTGIVCTMCNIHLLAFSRHERMVAERLLAYIVKPPVRRLFGVRKYTGEDKPSKIHQIWEQAGFKEVK